MPKFHFGYARTSQELSFCFEQIRKEERITKHVLVAELWQNKFPAKGHTEGSLATNAWEDALEDIFQEAG